MYIVTCSSPSACIPPSCRFSGTRVGPPPSHPPTWWRISPRSAPAWVKTNLVKHHRYKIKTDFAKNHQARNISETQFIFVGSVWFDIGLQFVRVLIVITANGGSHHWDNHILDPIVRHHSCASGSCKSISIHSSSNFNILGEHTIEWIYIYI